MLQGGSAILTVAILAIVLDTVLASAAKRPPTNVALGIAIMLSAKLSMLSLALRTPKAATNSGGEGLSTAARPG